MDVINVKKMKRNIWIMMLVALTAGISSVSAEGMKGGMKAESKDAMMGKGMMMMKMMEKTVVATSDGGIVVVLGNKITKYDKDLNVLKEIEIKMDRENMKKDMDDMMKMCPMMGGMDKQSNKTQEAAPADAGEVDHASHH